MMSQRAIEIVVGKLVVDRGFRRTFLQWPHRSLMQLSTTGVVLSDLEVSALVATDRALWSRLAECVDPRLQVDEAADANESADELAAHRSSALRLQTERVETASVTMFEADRGGRPPFTAPPVVYVK